MWDDCFIFQDGATSLFLAAQEGHVTVIRMLLSYGAKVNQAREVTSSFFSIFRDLKGASSSSSPPGYLTPVIPITPLSFHVLPLIFCITVSSLMCSPGWHCPPVDGSSGGSQWGGEGASLAWCRSGCWQTSMLSFRRKVNTREWLNDVI